MLHFVIYDNNWHNSEISRAVLMLCSIYIYTATWWYNATVVCLLNCKLYFSPNACTANHNILYNLYKIHKGTCKRNGFARNYGKYYLDEVSVNLILILFAFYMFFIVFMKVYEKIISIKLWSHAKEMICVYDKLLDSEMDGLLWSWYNGDYFWVLYDINIHL